MHHWIGAGLMIVGAGAAAIVFTLNSQTPIQLGPVPFFGSCALIFVGILVWAW
jgi:hypothetical protein